MSSISEQLFEVFQSHQVVVFLHPTNLAVFLRKRPPIGPSGAITFESPAVNTTTQGRIRRASHRAPVGQEKIRLGFGLQQKFTWETGGPNCSGINDVFGDNVKNTSIGTPKKMGRKREQCRNLWGKKQSWLIWKTRPLQRSLIFYSFWDLVTVWNFD